jgi:hypothetical protein
MSPYWIQRAMTSGMGILTVRAITSHMFVATMTWKHGHGYRRESKKSGKICTTFAEALESLESKLQEDAAEEMVRRGAA